MKNKTRFQLEYIPGHIKYGSHFAKLNGEIVQIMTFIESFINGDKSSPRLSVYRLRGQDIYILFDSAEAPAFVTQAEMEKTVKAYLLKMRGTRNLRVSTHISPPEVVGGNTLEMYNFISLEEQKITYAHEYDKDSASYKERGYLPTGTRAWLPPQWHA